MTSYHFASAIELDSIGAASDRDEAKGQITMLDPNLRRSEQMRTIEENRRRLEKQGIYKAPNFMLMGTAGFVLLVLIIVILLFIVHP